MEKKLLKLKEIINNSSSFIKLNGGKISIEYVYAQIQKNYTYIMNREGERVAICQECPLLFMTELMASLLAKKNVILIDSSHGNLLKAIKNEYDYNLKNMPTQREDALISIKELELNPSCIITLFTSGSSGAPKKVVKQLEGLICEVDELEKLFGPNELKTNFFSTVSHKHIYGLIFRIIWPLFKKHPLVVENILYPEELEYLSNHSFLVTSPAFIKRIPNTLKNISKKEIQVFSSGGELKKKNAEQCFNLFGYWPNEIYGSTETGGVAYRRQDLGNVSFREFPNVSTKLNKNGCLKVFSNFFNEDYIDTDDLVEVINDKEFNLIGRVGRTVKVEEKRISLQEIDKCLRDFSGIADSYCFVSERKGRIIVNSVILLDKNSDIETLSKLEKVKKVKDYLSQLLDSIVVPKRYRFVDKLPYDSQFKIKHSEVLEMFR